MRLYDNAASSNCQKVRILLRQLELDYERIPVDLFAGDTRTAEHMARNPDGRVPVLELDDGTTIAESGAILLYLAEGTPYLPGDRVTRARVHQWMFFEQNRIECELALARFLLQSGQADEIPDATAHRVQRARGALEALERGLADGRPFVAGDDYTVADIALYGYVHTAPDVGIDLAGFAHITSWIDRVEGTPRFVNDLEDMPAHARSRPRV